MLEWIINYRIAWIWIRVNTASSKPVMLLLQATGIAAAVVEAARDPAAL